MNTLAEIFDSIAGTFDSSTITSDQDGSLIEHLKYIEENMGSLGVGSDSLDFDEFVDAMTLDASTTITGGAFALTFDHASVSGSFEVGGVIKAADGSTTAPAYSFSGDTDSGIFRSAGTVTFQNTSGANSVSTALNASTPRLDMTVTNGTNTITQISFAPTPLYELDLSSSGNLTRQLMNLDTAQLLVSRSPGAASSVTVDAASGGTGSFELRSDDDSLSPTRTIYINGTQAAGMVRIESFVSDTTGTTLVTVNPTYTNFSSNVSVSGNFELSGFVSSNLTPTVTNTYSLGTSALRWSNLFANNASISNNLEVNNIASVSQLYVGGLLFSGVGVGSDSLDFDEFVDAMTLDANLTVASAGFTADWEPWFTSSLIPATDDTYDLGSTTNRWRDIYVSSGSIHMGTVGNEAVIDYDTSDPVNKVITFKPDGVTPALRIFSNGNASISGVFHVSGSLLTAPGTLAALDLASVSTALEVVGYASTSQFFGSGLVDCDTAATSKLLWDSTTGRFSCGTDQAGSGSSFMGLAVREGTGSFAKVTSLSFDSAHFVLSTIASASTLALDWGTGGPASLSQNETVSGLWTFSTGASITANLEIGGYASVGGNLLIGGSTDQGRFSIKGGGGQNLMNLASSGGNVLRLNSLGDFEFKRNATTYIPASGSYSITSSASNAGAFQIKYNRSPFGTQVMAGAFMEYNSVISEEFNKQRTTQSSDLSGAQGAAMGDGGGWGTYEDSACTFSSVADGAGGIMRVSAAGTDDGCMVMMDEAANNARLILDADQLPVLLMKVRPSVSDANHLIYIGMGDSTDGFPADTDRPTNFIGFTNDGASSTSWSGVARSSGVSTKVSCGVSISTTQYALMMVEVHSTTDVRFFMDADVSNGVDFTSCDGAVTTNVPTTALAPQIHYRSHNAGAAANLDVDFFRAWQDDPPPVDPMGTVAMSYASGSHIAQLFPAADMSMETGTVVSLDVALASPSVYATNVANDPQFVGVTAANSGLLLHSGTYDGVAVAVAGNASVKVSTANGNIAIGDYLSTSTTAGVAVKSSKGPVIGRALTAYSGVGVGRVVVALQSGLVNNLPLFELTGAASISSNLEVGGTASISGRTFMTGLSATAVADNFVCRNPTTGEITFGATCTASSVRFKKNIEDLDHGLDWVRELRPVTFDWKHDGEPSLGFIAEEVNEVSPLLAIYQDDKVYSVNYQIMTSVLAKAIQELDAKFASLSTEGPIDFDSESWFSGLFSRIVGAFKDLLGIEFEQGRVKANILCAGSTCVNEEQLQKLLDAADISDPQPSEDPEPTETPSPSPSDEPSLSDTPIPEPIPSDEPSPTEEPTPEPENDPTPDEEAPASDFSPETPENP